MGMMNHYSEADVTRILHVVVTALSSRSFIIPHHPSPSYHQCLCPEHRGPVHHRPRLLAYDFVSFCEYNGKWWLLRWPPHRSLVRWAAQERPALHPHYELVDMFATLLIPAKWQDFVQKEAQGLGGPEEPQELKPCLQFVPFTQGN